MIRILLLLVITASVLALAAADQPTRPTPVMHTLAPPTAKIGTQVVAAGENLGKDFVAEVYLTQGNDTFQAAIKGQTATSITFVVPAALKAGRFGLMVLTRGSVPMLLDEPVFVTVE